MQRLFILCWFTKLLQYIIDHLLDIQNGQRDLR